MPARPDPTTPRDASFVVAGMTVPASPAAPGLYLVATPIGNLGDITLRALQTLAGADVIACEDTRVTAKLLDRFAIARPLTPYHEHNAQTARPKLIERLKAGAAIALVSDAGTPLISDPGFKLVREASSEGIPVTALPGASSVLTALSLAALPTDRFFFEGFLPAKQTARRKRIATLAATEATLVLFEAGSRIAAALADLAELIGDRES
jgi:16S rRNA (cytidine1402-2'-O)-methyltransferase